MKKKVWLVKGGDEECGEGTVQVFVGETPPYLCTVPYHRPVGIYHHWPLRNTCTGWRQRHGPSDVRQSRFEVGSIGFQKTFGYLPTGVPTRLTDVIR